MVWTNEGGNAAKKFAKSLTDLNDGAIADAIINILFANSENIYFCLLYTSRCV